MCYCTVVDVLVLRQAWGEAAESVLRGRPQPEEGLPPGGGRGVLLHGEGRHEPHHPHQRRLQGRHHQGRGGESVTQSYNSLPCFFSCLMATSSDHLLSSVVLLLIHQITNCIHLIVIPGNYIL